MRHVQDARPEPRWEDTLYRTLVEHIDLGITLIDPDHRVLMANAAHGRLLRTDPASFIGKPCFEVFERREAVCPHCPGNRAMETERPQIAEIDNVRYDGTPLSVRIHAFPLPRLHGKPSGFIEVVEDITVRKQGEKRLKLTQFSVDHAPDAAFWMGPDGRFFYVNDAACRSLGYSREELLSMAVHDIDPNFTAEAWPAYWEDVKTRGSFTLESRHRSKDGRDFPVEVMVHYLQFDGEEYNCAYARNIAERKAAEESLREAEGRYRQLVEAAFEGISVTENGRFLEVDEDFARIFGYTPSELVGASVSTLIAPEHREAVMEKIRTDYDRPYETVCIRKDGTRIPLEASGKAIVYHGRKARVTAVRDISRRKLAEQNLRESEERYRALFESAIEGILVVDTQTKAFLHANPAACRLLGYSENELRHMHAPDVHPEEYLEFVHSRFEAHARRERGVASNIPFLKKDGTTFVGDITSAHVALDGRPCSVEFITDVTERYRVQAERKRLAAQLQHAQRLESLGVLAGGIAHDFNNLLMGILGHADLALSRLDRDSPAKLNVEKIVAGSERAADLVDQLLAYAGKGPFVVGPVHLSDLVQEMAGLLQTVVSKKPVLQFELASDLPGVRADATQVRQVIMNLIMNASDAIGDDNGLITVTTGRMEADRGFLSGTHLAEDLPEGGYVFVEVKDTGCGMGAETQARVFDPFFSTKFVGRGLGLAAVLGIVRAHRGAVKVSSAPGCGSTFTVLLPCGKERISERKELPDEVHPLEETGPDLGTVLVVDDEETVASVAREMLERSGYDVVTARNGREGLAALRKHPTGISVVLLDLTMPEKGGVETFQEMRRIRPDLKVILSSGYTAQHAVERFADKGLSGFIQKPYRSSALLQAVREALAQ